jgi:hypothetical protein
VFLAKKKKPHYTNHEVIPMKVRAVIARMLAMRPEAWYIFIRSLQLSCFLHVCAAMLLIAWDGDSLRGFRFYRQAQTLSEYAQLALLAAVIVPPCVEEWTR